MRRGVRTSEFWLALFVAVASAIPAAWATSPWAQAAGAIAAALASMGYGMARAEVKKAEQKATLGAPAAPFTFTTSSGGHGPWRPGPGSTGGVS